MPPVAKIRCSFSKRECGTLRQHSNFTQVHSGTDCLTKGGNSMTRHGALPERHFWRDLSLRTVACDKSRKAMSTNTIVFRSGRHIFPKLCSHQSLSDFFFLLISIFGSGPRKRRPDLTPMYTETRVSPRHLLAPEQHALCETYSSHWNALPEKTLPQSVREDPSCEKHSTLLPFIRTWVNLSL